MNLNPISLSFTGEQHHLEKQFLTDYFRKYLSVFRVCHFFSIFFFGIFAVVDYLVFYDQVKVLLFIRFGVVIPIFLLGFAQGGTELSTRRVSGMNAVLPL